MSSESDFAWRAARYYGPQVAQWDRSERIKLLRTRIAQLENLTREERAAHKASCPRCQSGVAFACLYGFSVTPEQSARGDTLSFLRGLVHHEEQDEAYAQKARLHPVKYKQHIDGFCSYWQNLRHRKFESVGWKCERCNKPTNELDAHHLHYDTLGYEELCDLQALCRRCHECADRERAASTQYNNAMDTFLRKKYGECEEYWPDYAEEEFDRWLERKQAREWP